MVSNVLKKYLKKEEIEVKVRGRGHGGESERVWEKSKPVASCFLILPLTYTSCEFALYPETLA